jgi:hypothetical protein
MGILMAGDAVVHRSELEPYPGRPDDVVARNRRKPRTRRAVTIGALDRRVPAIERRAGDVVRARIEGGSIPALDPVARLARAAIVSRGELAAVGVRMTAGTRLVRGPQPHSGRAETIVVLLDAGVTAVTRDGRVLALQGVVR